jgi:hypothetical protein
MSRSALRLALAATGILVLWLAGIAVADASPGRRHSARAPRQLLASMDVRAAVRTARLYSSTRKGFFVIAHRLVHRHVKPKLQHNGLPSRIEDEEAIAPAVGGHEELPRVGSLEPIGMLVLQHSPPTTPDTITRRSPRGPPLLPA